MRLFATNFVTLKTKILLFRCEAAVRVCVACAGWAGRDCVSLDCPALYRRRAEESRRGTVQALHALLENVEF